LGEARMKKPALERAKDTARRTFTSMPVSVQRGVLQALDRHAPWDQGLPPTAPAPPPGMTTGAPDFVGVGMSKCGTSWWFSLIMSHPEVHVEHGKELLFFNRPFLDHLNSGRCTPAEVETYQDWFPRPAGTITGEWTPHYAFRYQLPPILRVAAPGAKILFMLRDPVERYLSDISRTMPKRVLESVRLRSLVNGLYSSVLRPWEAVYDPAETLVLQFEQCLKTPEEMLARTFRFLGVDDRFRPADLTVPVNETRSKRVLADGMEAVLPSLYERDVTDIDLALWPNFGHLLGLPVFPPSRLGHAGPSSLPG
jgi:hypothetical protein